MDDVLIEHAEPIAAPDGSFYVPRVRGRQVEDGLWNGWIEFVADGGRRAIATARETTQPNRVDLLYWAEGLGRVYLEGALVRALDGAAAR